MLKKYFKRVGPGVITGVSDDDPSGIATYTQAGALLGLKLLWTALLTYPLMYSIQEMSARIGILNPTGMIGVVKRYYPPFFAWSVIALIIPAIIFNIAADLASMGAILHLLFPIIPTLIFTILIVAISLGYMIFCCYKTISNVFKIFCLALLCYIIIPFLVDVNWLDVLYATFIPHFEWTRDYLYLFVAVLGTTISPYLFVWQASLSHEDHKQVPRIKKQALRTMRSDVSLGMFISNLAMYFIILTTASVLHDRGLTDIQTVEDAARALEPIAGKLAYFAFAMGVLGVGFLAIPVLAGSIGYILGEALGQPIGLNKKAKEAKVFYAAITLSMFLALGINIVGIDPIGSLVLTALLYGIITPPILLLILHICNNKAIMGKNVNTLYINILGVLTFLLMTFALVALILMTLYQ